MNLCALVNGLVAIMEKIHVFQTLSIFVEARKRDRKEKKELFGDHRLNGFGPFVSLFRMDPWAWAWLMADICFWFFSLVVSVELKGVGFELKVRACL